MKKRKTIDSLLMNDKIAFATAVAAAIIIWVCVVIFAGSQTTRVIHDVKVKIDETVPAQFGLQVFGESEFTVDVTVSGKKYRISEGSLSAENISVVAQTTTVDSAGVYTLQLKAEYGSDNRDYTIKTLSAKTVEVYFDTEKTDTFVIEPDIKTDGFEIAKTGFTCGDINLSQSAVTITGPSTEVNRIEKVLATVELDESLDSNKSAETKVVPYDDQNKTNFKYLSMNIEDVVVTIPILRVKKLDSVITFKNAPDSLLLNPLKYSITPNTAEFNILVDDYDKTTEYVVGSINFKELSPTSNTFTFDATNTEVIDESIKSFVVSVNMDDYTQEYMKIPLSKIKINNPDNIDCKISELNKSVVIVGTAEALKGITEDMISVEADLTSLIIEDGETKTIPVVVTVDSASCWIYGAYTVDVTLAK